LGQEPKAALMKKRFLFLPAVCLLTVSCLFLYPLSAGASAQEILSVQEAKSIRYWGLAWKEKPLSLRIARAPDVLIKKLLIENDLYGFRERPTPADTSPEFEDVVKNLEASLPDKVRKLLAGRLIGIFLVDHLGSTGFTDAVMDEDRREKYAFIVLDKGLLLKRKANDWATWKENSVFQPQQGNITALDVTIETASGNNVKGAIRLILLHEIGHAVGMTEGIHPSWNEPASVSDQFPFTMISWQWDKGKLVSRYDRQFPERELIRFYAGKSALLTKGQTGSIYRILYTATDFPSLQASVDIWEDFAETFATYIHVVREGRPYEVRLRKEGQDAVVYRSCWRDGRCEIKRQFVEKWLNAPPVHNER
jgi:hypothetical protein